MRWSFLIVAIAVALGRIFFKNYSGLIQLYTKEIENSFIQRVKLAYTAPDQRHLAKSANPAAKNKNNDPEHIFVDRTESEN